MVNGTVKLFPDGVAAVLPPNKVHWLLARLPPPPSVIGPSAPVLASLNRYKALLPCAKATLQSCAASPTEPKSKYTTCKSEAPLVSEYRALKTCGPTPPPLLGVTDTVFGAPETMKFAV